MKDMKKYAKKRLKGLTEICKVMLSDMRESDTIEMSINKHTVLFIDVKISGLYYLEKEIVCVEIMTDWDKSYPNICDTIGKSLMCYAKKLNKEAYNDYIEYEYEQEFRVVNSTLFR